MARPAVVICVVGCERHCALQIQGIDVMGRGGFATAQKIVGILANWVYIVLPTCHMTGLEMDASVRQRRTTRRKDTISRQCLAVW